jgi:hypothetical protein
VAKTKCPEIAAEVERQLKALREGPKTLTAKQIAALSSIVYRAFAKGLENNPGLTNEGWLRVAEANEVAKQGNPLLHVAARKRSPSVFDKTRRTQCCEIFSAPYVRLRIAVK